MKEKTKKTKCASCEARQTVRPAELKHELSIRLARIEGQVRAVKRMVENDTYCDDLLAQVAAARGALHKLAIIILDHHIRHCLVDHIKNGDDSIIDEVLQRISRNFG